MTDVTAGLNAAALSYDRTETGRPVGGYKQRAKGMRRVEEGISLGLKQPHRHSSDALLPYALDLLPIGPRSVAMLGSMSLGGTQTRHTETTNVSTKRGALEIV